MFKMITSTTDSLNQLVLGALQTQLLVIVDRDEGVVQVVSSTR